MSGRTGDALPPVVVVGLDELVGIQTARIFARRGVEVIGVARRPEHYACSTRYVKRQVVANTYSDEVIPALVALGETLDQKAVLVPCIDESVLRVSRNRSDLDPYYIYALPDRQTVDILTDKEEFFRFALREKLPIPRTFLVSSPGEVKDAAAEITYPCILKPSLKSPDWWTEFREKAVIVRTPEEFRSVYDRSSGFTKMLIAQEWIRGGEGALFSSNCYYDRQGKSRVTFIARKIRQWPPLTGFTSLGEECRNDTVLEQNNLVFGKVRYHGLGYLEIKRDEVSGEHKVIEANIGRPTGRSALAEGCGVELLYTMYCDVVGLPLPEKRVQSYRGGKWIQLVNDARSAFYFWRRGELTISEYLRSLRGIRVFAVWSLSDPMPFFVDLAMKLTNTVRMKLSGEKSLIGKR
jgi:predicted ATP-grasp superfamily ATP-dependent carboligase